MSPLAVVMSHVDLDVTPVKEERRKKIRKKIRKKKGVAAVAAVAADQQWQLGGQPPIRPIAAAGCGHVDLDVTPVKEERKEETRKEP